MSDEVRWFESRHDEVRELVSDIEQNLGVTFSKERHRQISALIEDAMGLVPTWPDGEDS